MPQTAVTTIRTFSDEQEKLNLTGVHPGLPKKLQIDLSVIPKLTLEQAGHIRHFYNMASQPDNLWSHMGSQEPGQEWLDSYRYQLANATYAASLAHYHRLPAARSIFKDLVERLIKRMLLPAVWNYWYLTSQGGNRTNPDAKEMRKPWADPIVRENIMVSSSLNSLPSGD